MVVMTEPAVDADSAPDAAAVFAVHAQRLTALATVLAGPSSAEDVVSAVMVKALGSSRWRDVRDPGAYLTRAVVNQVRSAHRSDLRREARERRTARPEIAEDADPLPEIMDALAALPLRQRATVFLTYWGDMTPPMVAAHLGIGEGSVRKHLARARETLRKELA
jgi:RNA polymerase sigma factor (sigma-70 family)